MFFSTTRPLTFPQTIVLRYTQLEPPERRLPQAAEDYAKWFLGRLRAIDAVVDRQGGLSSAAAASRQPTASRWGTRCGWPKTSGCPRISGPTSSAYWQRLQARDGYQRAVAAETLAGEQQKVARRCLNGSIRAVAHESGCKS